MYGLIAFVSVGATMAFLAAEHSMQAEYTYHAEHLTADLLCDYIRTHDGAWPRSWDDLQNVAARDLGMYQWPADADEIRKRVAIDFAADPQQVAQQSPDEFAAVHYKGPSFEGQDERVAQPVIAELRKFHAATPID